MRRGLSVPRGALPIRCSLPCADSPPSSSLLSVPFRRHLLTPAGAGSSHQPPLAKGQKDRETFNPMVTRGLSSCPPRFWTYCDREGGATPELVQLSTVGQGLQEGTWVLGSQNLGLYPVAPPGPPATPGTY